VIKRDVPSMVITSSKILQYIWISSSNVSFFVQYIRLLKISNLVLLSDKGNFNWDKKNKGTGSIHDPDYHDQFKLEERSISACPPK
jgi:hypothetical protein